MISETRERFLRAIVGTVPPERIAEIHFFPPIKQGGVESGVAVIAAGEPAPEPVVAAEAEGVAPPAESSGATEGDELPPDADARDASDRQTAVAYPVDGPADLATAEGDDELEPSPEPESDAELSAGAHPAHEHPAHDELADVVERAVEEDEGRRDEGVAAERVVPIAARATPSMTDDIPTTPVLDDLASGEEAGAEGDVPDEPAPQRFTVFTARYRLVLKGLDRGKWEASVVAEADAPLLTVEAVVRGVQRRSGDVDDPERMSGDEVRAELARMEAAAAALRTPGALRAS